MSGLAPTRPARRHHPPPAGRSARPSHLTDVVPDGVDCVLDVLGLELFGADVDDGIRVGLALAEEVAVLLHQVLALDQPKAQHALREGQVKVTPRQVNGRRSTP